MHLHIYTGRSYCMLIAKYAHNMSHEHAIKYKQFSREYFPILRSYSVLLWLIKLYNCKKIISKILIMTTNTFKIKYIFLNHCFYEHIYCIICHLWCKLIFLRIDFIILWCIYILALRYDLNYIEKILFLKSCDYFNS